jgi:hypothetical protein
MADPQYLLKLLENVAYMLDDASEETSKFEDNGADHATGCMDTIRDYIRREKSRIDALDAAEKIEKETENKKRPECVH